MEERTKNITNMMWILIKVDIRGTSCVLVSNTKSKIEQYLREHNYYYSKTWDRYINKNPQITDIDYYIEKIKKL
jgi:hypothetical protein